MSRFLAVVATWLMVLVALAQGGPGGPGGGGQPTLSLVGSFTNWTGNSPATNRFLFPAQLPSTEGFTHPVVYTKGGSAQLQVFFQNNNPQQDFVGNLIVQDARFIHSTPPAAGTPGSPPPVTITDTILSAPTVSLSVPIGQTSPASLSLGGLPSFVTHGYIQLTMRVEGNFGAQTPGGNPSPWSGIVPTQKVYITLSNPVGVMNPVWTELAEMSCSFAQLEANPTDVNRQLTRGLFSGRVFKYNLPAGTSVYADIPAGGTGPNAMGYNLKLLLTNRYGAAAGGGVVFGGCADINGFLCLLHLAQGIDSSARIVYGIYLEGEDKFLTNPFVPIGYDASNSAHYIRVRFAWHLQVQVSGLISDAAMAYLQDLNGQEWKKPAFAWAYEGSWQTFNAPEMYGLAYRQYLDLVDYNGNMDPPYDFPVWFAGPSPAKLENKAFETYTITVVF